MTTLPGQHELQAAAYRCQQQGTGEGLGKV